MSRDSEKAQSMLHRFHQQQAKQNGLVSREKERRPRDIQSITDVGECEKWRGDVVREISRKISKIQDPSLNDYSVRDLNDAINRLMRQKYAWEVQIRSLGGPNYMRTGMRTTEDGGREVAGNKGYKYYGRARELPGVKQLLEQGIPREPLESHRTQIRHMNAEYYGLDDYEDAELLAYEEQEEKFAKKNVDQLVKENNGQTPQQGRMGDVQQLLPSYDEFEVPSQNEVEKYLLHKRKSQLLDKYL